MPGATRDFENRVEDFLQELLEGYTPLKIRGDKIIRDAILGHNVFYTHEINLIDSPLMQRLRRVHQTALAYLTYPAATHTRFEHSLGVVIFTQKMIEAVNKKAKTELVDKVQATELRLAALLHDCGHGVFSHASEIVYDDWNPAGEIRTLRHAHPELFGEAAGHEILSYYIVRSAQIRKLWEDIISNYDAMREKLLCDLGRVSLERVANMIIGVKAAPDYPLWLSKIVNGPFDADKLDYMGRDGYFSGLVTPIDTDRLFVSLSIFDPRENEPFICVDIGGANVLEQILFNKMLLFSSVYNHHKVRGSFRMIASLLQEIRSKRWTVSGTRLKFAVDFLRLDEYDLLNSKQVNKEVRAKVRKLRERILLKRALVISPQAIKERDLVSQHKFFELEQQQSGRNAMELELAQRARCDTVFVDFPPNPRVEKIGKQSMVRLSENTAVPLSKLYPTSGWIEGYAEIRQRAYVLAPSGYEDAVASLAFKLFAEKEIKLNKKLCLELAKRPRRPSS
jgi:HD superfamily phosphohydrolase